MTLVLNFQGWTAHAAKYLFAILLMEIAIISWGMPTYCEYTPAYCELNIPFNRLMATALGVLAVCVATYTVD
jgi:hypothetical protein